MTAVLSVLTAAAIGLVAFNLGLLRLGDAAHNVDLYNATGVAIILYQDAAAPRGHVSDVEPSAIAESAWLWPIESSDKRTRVVKATDRNGTLLYCRAFTFAELERIGWRIEITRQSLASCPPGR